MSKKYPKILSLDIAKRTGFAITDGNQQIIHKGSLSLHNQQTRYQKLNMFIRGMDTAYGIDMIIAAYPVRYYSVLASHYKFFGIICLFCEERGIPLIEISEMQHKKFFFNNGHVKKDEIKKFFNTDDEDMADALFFINAYYSMNYDIDLIDITNYE